MPAADVLSQSLARLKSRYAATPVPRFLRWWGSELLACLPTRWRRLLEVEQAQLLLQLDGEQLQASVSGSRGIRTLPAVSPASEGRERLDAEVKAALSDQNAAKVRRVLLLPAWKVLRRTLSLPTAASENLRAVLGFELDRQTPFKPDQVYFDHRVVRLDAAQRLLSVELALVPRAQLDTALAQLGAFGEGIDAVDVAGGAPGMRAGFNLLPPERRVRRFNTALWSNLGLMLAAAILVLAAMSATLSNRERAVEALQQEVEQRREEARAVAQQRKSLEDAAAGANFLAVKRSEQPLVIDLLRELTRLLPDDTYLESLRFNEGRVELQGQSNQAAKLLEILQASGAFRAASFTGNIQPDPRTGKDRFNLSVEYGPVKGGGNALAARR